MTPSSDTLNSPAGPSGGGVQDAAGRRPARRVRAVPVLLGLLLVAVVALAVSPGLRRQLQQSFARQDQRYVELYFADENAARTCPTTADGALTLDARVRSHLADAAGLAWIATVRPTVGSAPSQVRGTVSTRPGTTSGLVARFPAADTPAGGYTATIELAGRHERLSLHC